MIWLILLCSLTLILAAYLDTRKPKHFPPGPEWYPLIGSAPQISKARRTFNSLFEATAHMSRRYGPVIGLRIGKDPIVVVYGPQEIKEMSLSDNFVGRPLGSFFDIRTFNKRRGILLTDSDLWQEQKRFLVRQLREFGFGTKNMSVLVEDEVGHLINSIDNTISKAGSAIFNMESLCSVSVLNTLWKMMAGVRYSPEDTRMKHLQKILSDLFKTVHIVGAPFRYVAPELSGYKCYIETHEHIWKFLREELETHKKTHNPHEPRDLIDVYLNVLLTPNHAESFTEEQLMAICLDMFVAGSETTNNSISFGLLYLVINQRVQKKAQQEIDNILGDRLPRLEDRPNLPYMDAVVQEALRMFGCRAFAVPHRALKDTYLGGYLIPKDTMVTANFHGCMMGTDSGFENPEEFIPERYLKNGKVTVPENFMPFGVGRRRCMGESLARANIFLFLTAVLQKYNLQTLPNDPPDMKVVDGVTPAPIHFKAKLTPRAK